MSLTPIVPSMTTTTTTTTTTGTLLQDTAAPHVTASGEVGDDNASADVVNWVGSSSPTLNALDMWLEQATSGAVANHASFSKNASHSSGVNSAHSFTLADLIGNPDPSLALDFKVEQDVLSGQYPALTTSADPSDALPVPETPSVSTTPVFAPAPVTPVAFSGAQSDAPFAAPSGTPSVAAPMPSVAPTSAAPISPVAHIASAAPAASNSPAEVAPPIVSPLPIQSSLGSRSNSPMHSQSDLHSHSAPTVAETVPVTAMEEYDEDGLPLFAEQASSHDGLSAVERAKQSAEQFTMNQLSKRKRKATSPPTNSLSDEEGGDESKPERQSHLKYQKRLQKNRDSAFVSRIRRREYTRLLETSLTAVEKEKDAAMAAFREMKRRFDVVSAELVGIKTAAASNFVGLRDAVINRVTVPESPVLARSSVTQEPYQPMRNPHDRLGRPQGGAYTEQQQNMMPAVGRRGTFMTTMYMVALVVGVLLPDVTRRSPEVDKLISWAKPSAGEANSNASSHVAMSVSQRSSPDHGRVWGSHVKPAHPAAEEYMLEADISGGAAGRLLDAVREDAVARLGEEVADRALESVQRYLQMLSAEQVATIEKNVLIDDTYKGFEALLRAVVRDDGANVGKDLDMDEIISEVAGINFQDRV